MFKVLTRRATIPLVTVRLLLSPPACGTVEGLAGQRHVQAASSSLSSLKRQLKTALFARSFAGIFYFNYSQHLIILTDFYINMVIKFQSGFWNQMQHLSLLFYQLLQ